MATATLTRPANGSAGTVPGSRSHRLIESAATDRLLRSARAALAEADLATDAGERYAAAHLAGLRAAAAVLAARAAPAAGRSRRPASAWTLLCQVAPDLAEWAGYFASGADKRAAAQAGVRGAVSTREADDLLRNAVEFTSLVEGTLGMLPLGFGE
jgi:hypothetical protein